VCSSVLNNRKHMACIYFSFTNFTKALWKSFDVCAHTDVKGIIHQECMGLWVCMRVCIYLSGYRN